MAKLPDPPGIAALAKLSPPMLSLPIGTVVARILFAGGDHPTSWDQFRYYGPTASRFDHQIDDEDGKPQVQARGIMYLTAGKESVPTCLAEVFQTTRVIDRHSKTPILVGFKTVEPISLLDLTGTFATAMGASMAIHSGPRARARQWARQLYQAFPEAQGIYYCSSMFANQPAIALFERAKTAIPNKPVFHRTLNDIALYSTVVETARKIGYQVV